MFLHLFTLNCLQPVSTIVVCGRRQQSHNSCVFAGKLLIQTDHWGCVEAWTSLVWTQAFSAAPLGPWCPQLQPPGHGLLQTHSSAPQGSYKSAGQQDFWVGPISSGQWGYWRGSKNQDGFLFFIHCRDPSDWSPETMEELGPLLLLDDNTTATLPNKVWILFLHMWARQRCSTECAVFLLFLIFINTFSTFMVKCKFFLGIFCFVCYILFCFCPFQPWMKDILYFLKSKLFHESKALRRKIFTLTTSSSNAARKKRAGEEETVCVWCKYVWYFIVQLCSSPVSLSWQWKHS